MNIRYPVFAGQFYESSPSSCRHHVDKLLSGVELPDDLPSPVFGGLVPHAGWMFSGQVAARTLVAVSRPSPPETVVIFGADHVGTVSRGEVYDSGAWQTPLGEIHVDDEVAQAILAEGEFVRSNPEAHGREHSIEVQLPLLQGINPACRIVPVAVPPIGEAVEIGISLGRILKERFPAVRVICSSDLTHHGGHFGNPGGHGEIGEQWSRKNDQRLLKLLESLDAEAIIPEADAHRNACGAGAIAACIAACREMGATRGICLEYTNSYVIARQMFPGNTDETTVGYASVVFV